MVRMRGRTRSVTTVPTRATTIPATSPLVRALAVRGGQHGDDEREATAEDEGHYEKPCCPPGVTGFSLRTPWRRRGDVEQLHDAQHDNVATSRVNDWAVSLMASAMVRYGVHVVASCSIV